MLSSKPPAERFGEVVLPHLADALALARWLTGNTSDAEDVLQEACLRAYAGIDTYAGGNARAWFLTIVRNVAYTWLAKNRPRALLASGDLADLDELAAGQTNTDDPDGPEAAMIAKADVAALEAAILHLQPPFREVVVLRDINGFGYRDIAAMLNLPLGTVMSRLSRARRLLMMQLGATDEGG